MLDGTWTGLINHRCHWTADMRILVMGLASMSTFWTRYAFAVACKLHGSAHVLDLHLCFSDRLCHLMM